MKNMWLGFWVMLIVCMTLVNICFGARAEDNRYGQPFDCEVTAYCIDGYTATGTRTREGICAAKKEWIGKTAIIYYEDELVGIYEIVDTGSHPNIKNGKRIDVWIRDKNEAKEFGIKKCKVQIIDAKG